MGKTAKAIGCTVLGCLSLPFLLVAVALGLAFVESQRGSRASEPRSATFEQPLPAAELPLEQPPGGTGETLPSEIPAAARPGTLWLDVTAAELDLEPVPAGQPLRVEADYDAASFELRRDFGEGREEWRYELTFGPRSWLRLTQFDDHLDPRLTVYVPQGQPLALRGRIRLAESTLELGGLALTEVDLDLGAGEHNLSFRRPSPRPLLRVKIDSSVGELILDRLGNASPQIVDIEHSAGSLLVDLDGAWRNDSRVRLDFGLGECRVRLPREARLEVEGARVALGRREIRGLDRDLPPEAPRIVLQARGSIGELRID